jgi:hypothetical protein
MLGSQIVHETIDGETVVINLATGNYYSIEGSGADLWSRLLVGETAEVSGSRLASEHGADSGAVTSAILAFHRELFDEGLITMPTSDAPGNDGDLGSFEVPRLHVYNDLQAHLLADPVHDVERGAGWPTIAP